MAQPSLKSSLRIENFLLELASLQWLRIESGVWDLFIVLVRISFQVLQHIDLTRKSI